MQSDLRLFGLDLSRPWMQASIAGRELLAAILRMLSPAPAVSIVRDNQAPAAPRVARYRAIELPEAILLRRSLQLPPTTGERLHSAIALDVQAHSPFPPEEAIWTFRLRRENQRQYAEWALTSRRLVETHLQERQLAPDAVEVWVAFGEAHSPLPGFGEAARLRHIRRSAVRNGVYLFTALALLAAIAITPTAKLRLQALQAQAAQHQLTQQAAPVLQQRERLMQLHAQAAQIQQTLNDGIAPLPAMAALTQALPDDTVLRSLRLQGVRANMNGQTANAADLMKQLGNHPGITEVRAPSAATRSPGASKEQFELELQLRPPAETAPAEPSGPAADQPSAPAESQPRQP